MMQFLIAAPRSGSGKTTVTCALLTALQRRGTDPCAFKCGPDYIDPMFHRSALGVESHNQTFTCVPGYGAHALRPVCRRARRCRMRGRHGLLRRAGTDHPRKRLGAGRHADAAGSAGGTARKGQTSPLLPSCRGFCSSARPAISWAFCSMIALKPCTKRCARCWKPRPVCRWWGICPICRDAPLRAATSG